VRHLGEVLVQEHVGDELLARGDAELFVEALDVVLDVWSALQATKSSH
jgi:hypothetical protein